MTTIAYRKGVLAGDMRETACAESESPIIVSDKCRKVFRLKDGRLFGGASASEDIVLLHQALEKKQPLPKLDDINGLLIDKRGAIWIYEGRIWQRIKASYYAIGSGGLYALAAMDAGASAIEAVRIGIKRDPYSGGRVTFIRLSR